MSASSGVEVRDELKKQFAEAATSDTGYIKMVIDSESFKQVASGRDTGTKMGNLSAIAPLLEARKPCYVATKTEEKDRWMLVFYIPDDSPVRDRMVYASSLASLKLGLGAAKFGQDFTIRDAKECSPTAYEESKKKVAEEDLLTMEERMGMRSESYVSMSTDNVRMSGMSALPLKISDDVKTAVTAIAAAGTTTGVVLSLDPKSEVMGVVTSGALDVAAVVRNLPPNEPRYAIVRFPHAHPDTKEESSPIVFVYYCPDVAGPRLKMFYSSMKSMALQTAAALNVTPTKQLEISVPAELTSQFVLDELYPKKSTTKAFAKPAKPGRAGTRGMHRAT
jgi:twinfilin-like protein